MCEFEPECIQKSFKFTLYHCHLFFIQVVKYIKVKFKMEKQIFVQLKPIKYSHHTVINNTNDTNIDLIQKTYAVCVLQGNDTASKLIKTPSSLMKTILLFLFVCV